ncbi:hypothetical protein OZX69_01540 [Lactobacillus sp. ESL0731]|uniref:hypothetical protein n=1 Tax=unclassified Lactobacillus TaxID=2620435 RepID=UPI0023F7A850|nr:MULTISPECIES: hypothetical protein [unclassified Lactobacillus]WEV51433.1 hypothetical protein OZX63_01540 [Lactobacillus sp. ESL0700]WEV62563.1 hypothetical protein OZX69_01540 [Lactobacillus sp. ESL0731]
MDTVIAFGLSIAMTILVLVEIISSLTELTNKATNLVKALDELKAALKKFKVK